MKAVKLVGLLMLSLIVLAACGESDIEKVDGSEAKADENKKDDGKKKEEKKEQKLKIGETVNFDGLKITLNSVKADKGSEFEEPEEDKFLIADMKVKNTTDDSQSVSSMLNVTLKDADDYKYDTTIYTGVKSQLDGEIASGDKMRGQIAFDVPKSKKYQLIFGDPFTSGQAIWKFKSGEIK